MSFKILEKNLSTWHEFQGFKALTIPPSIVFTKENLPFYQLLVSNLASNEMKLLDPKNTSLKEQNSLSKDVFLLDQSLKLYQATHSGV